MLEKNNVLLMTADYKSNSYQNTFWTMQKHFLFSRKSPFGSCQGKIVPGKESTIVRVSSKVVRGKGSELREYKPASVISFYEFDCPSSGRKTPADHADAQKPSFFPFPPL